MISDIAAPPSGIPVEFKGHSLRHVWPYRSEDGSTFGYVARYDNAEGRKLFCPFFDGYETDWKAGAEKAPRRLFGLDSLNGNRIFVVEGEKCAAALHSLGLAAVSSFGGSNSAHCTDWAPVARFSEVYLLPDNDEPGRRYAEDVGKILTKLSGCRRIYLCELPGLSEKGDISDWLQARVSGWDGFAPVPRNAGDDLLDEFYDEVGANSRIILDGQDALTPVDLTLWYTVAPPPLEFVFDGLVPRGTLIGIVAQGGMGKGWLTQELITSAAIGRELVQGFKPSGTMRVIWIESEDPSEEIHRRYVKITRAFNISEAEHVSFAQNVRLYAGNGFHLVKVESGNVIPTDDYYKLQDIVREWKPDLIVIDPLSHFYGGDENDNVVMAGFMNHIRALAEESRTTVWVNHHVSKNLQDTLSTAMGRGASALRDALRSMFALAPLTDQEINEFGITDSSLYLRLGHTKTNWTRRTGNVTYLKRDVSTADVSGVLRVVDLESDEKVNAEEMLDRAAKKLAIIIGENPDDLTERRIAKTSEGADVRYELQKGFPKLATTRAIIKVLSRAEILGFLTMERKGKAKIPRKSNSASGGFGRESEQKCASEQEACSNTQGSEKKELTESVQTEQEKTCTDSHKVLSDNDL